MARQRKQKSVAPEGFPEKSWNKLSDTWRTAAQAKQTEELEHDIIKAVRAMSNTSFDMRKDDKLEALQNEARELKSFYTETISAEKAKIDFCVYLLNSRGGVVTESEDE
jgi:hypothetical protein